MHQIVGETSIDYMDVRITEEVMTYLWSIINNSSAREPAGKELAGNISRSFFIQDKDNLFYENILKSLAELMYCKDWNNYYDIHITKVNSFPIFELRELWVNFQKQYEFNPTHQHTAYFSFVIFMKIPTHWKEQHALPWLHDVAEPLASNFQFIVGQPNGQVIPIQIPLSPEDEGRMLFFPGWLSHQVFPFYGSEEERVTVSGNILVEGQMPYLPIQEKINEH